LNYLLLSALSQISAVLFVICLNCCDIFYSYLVLVFASKNCSFLPAFGKT